MKTAPAGAALRIARYTLAALAVLLTGLLHAAGPLKAGDLAPTLDASGVVTVRPRDRDDATTRPMTLIFVKPDDAHSAQAIAAVDAVHTRIPRTALESETIVIISRVGDSQRFDQKVIPDGWEILSDNEDALYRNYRVIATPTVVIVGRDGKLLALHPGYSPSLADAVRHDLIRAIDGEDAFKAATPTPGIMKVQMGRALARRGLWDRALSYYIEAARQQPLPPDILLEQAAIYIELKKPAEAILILDSLPPGAANPETVSELRKRARVISDEMQAAEKPTNGPRK